MGWSNLLTSLKFNKPGSPDSKWRFPLRWCCMSVCSSMYMSRTFCHICLVRHAAEAPKEAHRLMTAGAPDLNMDKILARLEENSRAQPVEGI
eukprot:3834907-Karenia_brevis.AAC.1